MTNGFSVVFAAEKQGQNFKKRDNCRENTVLSLILLQGSLMWCKDKKTENLFVKTEKMWKPYWQRQNSVLQWTYNWIKTAFC